MKKSIRTFTTNFTKTFILTFLIGVIIMISCSFLADCTTESGEKLHNTGFLYVDRIEEGKPVIYDKNGNIVNIAISDIQGNIKEGSILKRSANGWIVDDAETDRVQNLYKSKLNNLYTNTTEPQNQEHIKILEPDECTESVLTNRINDKNIIIERIEGVCLDSYRNGRITNTSDTLHDYISYENIEGVQPGDKILTYCIYDLSNNYSDDIVSRTDFIID